LELEPELHLRRIGSVMQRGGAAGRGALQLKLPVPLHFGFAEFGVDGRRHFADGTVRSDTAVVVFQIANQPLIRLN